MYSEHVQKMRSMFCFAALYRLEELGSHTDILEALDVRPPYPIIVRVSSAFASGTQLQATFQPYNGGPLLYHLLLQSPPPRGGRGVGSPLLSILLKCPGQMREAAALGLRKYEQRVVVVIIHYPNWQWRICSSVVILLIKPITTQEWASSGSCKVVRRGSPTCWRYW